MANNMGKCCNSQKDASCCRITSKPTKEDEEVTSMNKLRIDSGKCDWNFFPLQLDFNPHFDRTKISTESENQQNSPKLSKRFGRGAVESGLTHECGVFGAMACGDWPSQVRKKNL